HRKVAVLGVAFKADTDDERDSLAHKLIRLLERELADVAVHDPRVTTPTMSFEEAVDGADVVVVATNHSEFCTARSLAAIAERAATKGCSHVIHLAAIVGGIANFHRLPHTLTEANNALYNSVIRASLDLGVERFVYVSSSMVFERAQVFPTPEEHLDECPAPR